MVGLQWLVNLFDIPSCNFRTGDLSPLQCIDKHPGQPHIITTGGQDGTLGIWDLRHDKFPISLLEAHSKTSKFNRTYK